MRGDGRSSHTLGSTGHGPPDGAHKNNHQTSVPCKNKGLFLTHVIYPLLHISPPRDPDR